jgi:hypothetical protein
LSSFRSILSPLRDTGKLQKEQFVMNTVLVRSRILFEKSDKVASTLHPGFAYGHNIEFVRNMALWPLELQVHTKIKNEDQLRYLNTNSGWEWGFEVSLPPYHGDQRTAVVDCLNNISGTDDLFTSILSNAGYRDTVSIQIEIE